jgi:hypothetical protein
VIVDDDPLQRLSKTSRSIRGQRRFRCRMFGDSSISYDGLDGESVVFEPPDCFTSSAIRLGRLPERTKCTPE